MFSVLYRQLDFNHLNTCVWFTCKPSAMFVTHVEMLLHTEKSPKLMGHQGQLFSCFGSCLAQFLYMLHPLNIWFQVLEAFAGLKIVSPPQFTIAGGPCKCSHVSIHLSTYKTGVWCGSLLSIPTAKLPIFQQTVQQNKETPWAYRVRTSWQNLHAWSWCLSWKQSFDLIGLKAIIYWP